MVAVDTNVLLDAANPRSTFHQPCLELVDALRQQASPWYASWPICNEFLRVMTHPAALASPWPLADAWDFLEALFDSPGFELMEPTDLHRTIAGQVFAELPHLAGNILHDAHTAILMREYGIRRIFTRDTDFPFSRWSIRCGNPRVDRWSIPIRGNTRFKLYF